MRYAQIRDSDISNGVGIACSIFFQGCTNRCKNCFNKQTWDFEGGKFLSEDDIKDFISLCKQPFIDCISILGGEPFDQPKEELYNFVKRLREEVNKDIYIWSGYTYEELQKSEYNKLTLGECDYLIDGRYVEELKDYTLKLRGSSNQRVIDLKKTRELNKVVTLY